MCTYIAVQSTWTYKCAVDFQNLTASLTRVLWQQLKMSLEKQLARQNMFQKHASVRWNCLRRLNSIVKRKPADYVRQKRATSLN